MVFSYSQAQEMLGVSSKKMALLVAKGEIPGAYATSDGATVFDGKGLDDYAASKSYSLLRRQCGVSIGARDGDIYHPEIEDKAAKPRSLAKIGRSDEDDPARVAFFAELAAKRLVSTAR